VGCSKWISIQVGCQASTRRHARGPNWEIVRVGFMPGGSLGYSLKCCALWQLSREFASRTQLQDGLSRGRSALAPCRILEKASSAGLARDRALCPSGSLNIPERYGELPKPWTATSESTNPAPKN